MVDKGFKDLTISGVDSKSMGIRLILASKKPLDRAGLRLKDLGLDLEKTNVNGDSIALGHSIGASGVRILITILHEVKKQDFNFKKGEFYCSKK